ncbi:MAG: hypothetical protein SVO01_07635, partial [Thermotogota bacterium]|nr:hypothetical protein [Thermotogota bacterium]
WMNNRQIPLGRLFPSDWITEQVVRPLKQDAEIFVNFEMAEDRANQLIKTKIIDVEADDINLVDQLIRFKALEKISEWL